MNLFNTVFIFSLAFCFGATSLNAQNVTIPDAAFKTFLLGESTINTNGDSEIQVSEATDFTGSINCSFKSIANLTGIEAFVNLTELSCDNNELSSLDLTQNTSLTTLFCGHNELSSLDVTQNTSLTILRCYNNELSSLDVTQNTNLTYLNYSHNLLSSLDVTQNTNLTELWCNNNQFSSLDLTQNTNLIALRCYHNQLSSLDLTQNTSLAKLFCYHNELSSLDITQNTSLNDLWCNNNALSSLNLKNGNNTIFSSFYAGSNPNLNCIEVDDSTYSTANWTNVDATVTFSTDCSLFDAINTINKEINLRAYPNPTTKEITLDFGKPYQEANIQVTNLTGQRVLNKTVQNNSTASLEIEGAAGIYFVKIQTEAGMAILKIIKE